MDKFGRNYLLQVQLKDGSYVPITLPFTIEFDIVRHSLQSTNLAKIRIYNLGPDLRNQIRKNVIDFDFVNRGIILNAGYGTNLATIFKGTVGTAWSIREGNNFITQIESFDGGFDITNGFVNKQYVSGTPYVDIIADLARSFPKSTIGAIGNYPGKLTRGNSYTGNTAFLLNELTGGGFFIDNEKVYALGANEFIATAGVPLTINSKSGLLGTPMLEETTVHFDIIFEPSFNVGTSVILDSITADNFNRLYKLTRVKHRGMISSAVCGEVITTAEFFYSRKLAEVQPINA